MIDEFDAPSSFCNAHQTHRWPHNAKTDKSWSWPLCSNPGKTRRVVAKDQLVKIAAAATAAAGSCEVMRSIL